MKKQLLFTLMLCFAISAIAQDTITGWTFPANSGADSLNANLGTTQNQTYDMRFEWVLAPTIDSTVNTVTFTDGVTTYAAATAGWDNGMDVKFWSIKFKANNYSNFKVSSRQKSETGGPRDFKLQWRLSSTTFADVPNGTVTLGADWTAGAVTELPVPITGQGTSSIYIRWIMTSNNDINGGTVASPAQSMIDDILVTAVSSLGEQEILYSNGLKIVPSPNHGSFRIVSTERIDKVRVCDASGRTVFTGNDPSSVQPIALQHASPGLYILKVKFAGSEEEYSARFIVE